MHAHGVVPSNTSRHTYAWLLPRRVRQSHQSCHGGKEGEAAQPPLDRLARRDVRRIEIQRRLWRNTIVPHELVFLVELYSIKDKRCESACEHPGRPTHGTRRTAAPPHRECTIHRAALAQRLSTHTRRPHVPGSWSQGAEQTAARLLRSCLHRRGEQRRLSPGARQHVGRGFVPQHQ